MFYSRLKHNNHFASKHSRPPPCPPGRPPFPGTRPVAFFSYCIGFPESYEPAAFSFASMSESSSRVLSTYGPAAE